MTRPETIPAAAVLQAGEKIQLTDPKGRMHTIVLAAGEVFHTHKGLIGHDEIIGRPEGIVVTNSGGVDFQVFRPFYEDFVLSMPRGAAVVYPKDSGLIVTLGDIRPGATVVEAGVGSGALSIALARAVGPEGRVHSFELRGGVRGDRGGQHRRLLRRPTGELGGVRRRSRRAAPEEFAPGTVDRVVLDMLTPWTVLESVSTALAPGGAVVAYVATVPSSRASSRPCAHRGASASPTRWSRWSAAGTSTDSPCAPTIG